MSLDLFATASRDALDFAAKSPLPDLPATFLDGFMPAWDEGVHVVSSDAEARNRFEHVQGWIDRYQASTGERLLNPEGMPDENLRGYGSPRAAGYQDLRQRFTGARARPGFDLPEPPSPEEAARAGLERAKGSAARSAASLNRPQSFASGAGRMLGGMGAALRDPPNVLSMAIGAGAASGILRTALVEGAAGAGSQALVSAGTYDYRQTVDPKFGLADAAGEVGMAAAGGAILGSGIKGAAALWAKARTGTWPTSVRDAGNVTTREAAVDDAPWRDSGAQGEIAHRQRLASAEDAIAGGSPVELPPDTFSSNGWRPGRVYDSEGRSVGVSYEVVEAGDLVASNLDDFSVNPAFPAELQPRDRTRAMSQDQVNGIASQLDPERLGPSTNAADGAPIVGPDGVVESGNGRVLALRRVYADEGPNVASYKNFLKAQGFDTGEMRQPVLVARRVTDLDHAERQKFAAAANRATVLRLSATEQALADARLLNEGVMSRLTSAEIGAAGNRDFVRAFAATLPRAEQGSLFDRDGVLSQEGERRVTAALMGRAYGDAGLLGRILEDADSNVRGVGGALSDASGAWAGMRDAVARGAIPSGMDITDDLLGAMRLVAKSRDEGRPLADLLAQSDFIETPTGVTHALLSFMYRDGDLSKPASRKAVASALQSYAEEALKNTADERLFGHALSQTDVLTTALRKAGRDDLIGLAEERLTPALVEKSLSDSAIGDAVLLDLDRLRASRMGSAEVDGLESTLQRAELYANPMEVARRWIADPDAVYRDLDAIAFDGKKVERAILRKYGVKRIADLGDLDLEGKLTQAERDFLFYSEAPTDSTTLGELRWQLQPVHDLADAATEMSRAFRDLPEDTANMSRIEALAVMRLQVLFSEAERLGGDVAELIKTAGGEYASRFADLDDAEFMAAGAAQRLRELFGSPGVSAQPAGNVQLPGPVTGRSGDLMIPVTTSDEAGNSIMTMRSVDDLLDEFDEDIAAAREIEACVLARESAR